MRMLRRKGTGCRGPRCLSQDARQLPRHSRSRPSHRLARTRSCRRFSRARGTPGWGLYPIRGRCTHALPIALRIMGAFLTPPLCVRGGGVACLQGASASLFPHSMENEYFPWSSLMSDWGAFDFSAISAAAAGAAGRGNQLIFRVYADYPAGNPQCVHSRTHECSMPPCVFRVARARCPECVCSLSRMRCTECVC